MGNIDTISEGLFFDVSKEYILMNEQVFKFNIHGNIQVLDGIKKDLLK